MLNDQFPNDPIKNNPNSMKLRFGDILDINVFHSFSLKYIIKVTCSLFVNVTMPNNSQSIIYIQNVSYFYAGEDKWHKGGNA